MEENNLKAPFVMTCCGSLTKATLRWVNVNVEHHDPKSSTNSAGSKAFDPQTKLTQCVCDFVNNKEKYYNRLSENKN